MVVGGPQLFERWRARFSVTKAIAKARELKARTEQEGKRKGYGRDHHWRAQRDKAPAGSEQLSYGDLRDAWNDLTDEKRKAICPTCWKKIPEGRAGYDVVRQGVRKATGEVSKEVPS
jgi:hypothetical protein